MVLLIYWLILIKQNFSKKSASRVLIFCGKGNNGGDGLVAARYLDMWGYRVKVIITGELAELSSLTAKNYQLCQQREISICRLTATQREQLPVLIKEADIIVDALLGTGVTGKIRGAPAKIISLIIKKKQLIPGWWRLIFLLVFRETVVRF